MSDKNAPGLEGPILVSACLLGVACRYNGHSKRDDRVAEWLMGKAIVPVCPESLSGLPVPREPAEIESGDGHHVKKGKARVLMRDGRDVTKEFMRGAREALKIARITGARSALLKERSPSCGVHHVYNDGRLEPGVGVFTALLEDDGILVFSERDLHQGG